MADSLPKTIQVSQIVTALTHSLPFYIYIVCQSEDIWFREQRAKVLLIEVTPATSWKPCKEGSFNESIYSQAVSNTEIISFSQNQRLNATELFLLYLNISKLWWKANLKERKAWIKIIQSWYCFINLVLLGLKVDTNRPI